MTTPPIFIQLSQLRCAVARSRIAVAEGATIEMAGLDTEVMHLVDPAKAAPPSQREDILVTLEALKDDLAGLEADIRRQHDAAPAQRAASAYSADRSNG